MTHTLPPFVRTSKTSREAALSVYHTAPSRRQLILDAIRREGPCTDLDLERITGLTGSSVRPRRVELQRDGLIAEAGFARTPSGRKSVLWAAVPVQERLL